MQMAEIKLSNGKTAFVNPINVLLVQQDGDGTEIILNNGAGPASYIIRCSESPTTISKQLSSALRG